MFNEEQQKAIETIKGQLILVACPGSGKTTTLLGRIHEMIQQGVPAENILMVTFTTAAAGEMKQRFWKKYAEDGMVTFCTIHSFCLATLKKFAHFDAECVLATGDIYEFFFQQLVRHKEIVDKVEYIKALLLDIAVCKNSMCPLAQFEPNCGEKELFDELFKAYENWGVLAGIVTSIRTPTDKVTFLNIRIPSGRRDYNCRVTCLGRFQRAAANLKEGENVAVSCYVSVLDDTQRESRQSLVCTDLFSYGESDEAPKAPEEPTESLQPEEEANNDKNESFDPPAVPANPETGVDAFSEKTLQTANSNYEERHSENNPAHVETANAQMQYPFQRAQNNYYEETT